MTTSKRLFKAAAYKPPLPQSLTGIQPGVNGFNPAQGKAVDSIIQERTNEALANQPAPEATPQEDGRMAELEESMKQVQGESQQQQMVSAEEKARLESTLHSTKQQHAAAIATMKQQHVNERDSALKQEQAKREIEMTTLTQKQHDIQGQAHAAEERANAAEARADAVQAQAQQEQAVAKQQLQAIQMQAKQQADAAKQQAALQTQQAQTSAVGASAARDRSLARLTDNMSAITKKAFNPDDNTGERNDARRRDRASVNEAVQRGDRYHPGYRANDVADAQAIHASKGPVPSPTFNGKKPLAPRGGVRPGAAQAFNTDKRYANSFANWQPSRVSSGNKTADGLFDSFVAPHLFAVKGGQSYHAPGSLGAMISNNSATEKFNNQRMMAGIGGFGDVAAQTASKFLNNPMPTF